MDITELTYPVFEANQVLTNAHLNDLFEYLDEQQRLTRANLIGIGIACGLEASVTAGNVRLTKGVGVTSEGYLILEPVDVTFTWSAPYTVPDDDGYAPLTGVAELCQLFPADPGTSVADAAPLAGGGLQLDDMAVVLFLELRQGSLRNCSPNNCDDRGAQVTATLRPLLINVNQLDALKADNPVADTTERLALPDLRMPRFDVPNTNPVEPQDVLSAFQSPFRQVDLVAATIHALDTFYATFKPLIGTLPDDPNPFQAKLGHLLFLDAVPTTTADARFVQYYWDFFDDLIAAYDELRWKAIDLFCACCPSGDLFPRHLLAGLLDQPVGRDHADYRHDWLPSPAIGDCEDRTEGFRLLFDRLVRMIDTFFRPEDPEVRITPSRWGSGSLADKAIPYYFKVQDTERPVYEVWSPDKTTRRRANQNLSYRAIEFTPTAPPPPFVTEPLRFDLEPNNFLRIEGHLGRNVHEVLKELDAGRRNRRLPIDIIALRTGAFDEKFPVDLSDEDCRFEDLETLYETLKSELICFLVKHVKYFYGLAGGAVVIFLPEKDPVPHLWLLRTHAPDFSPAAGTIGRSIERYLAGKGGWVFALEDDPHLPNRVLGLVTAMSDLSVQLRDDIRQVDFSALAARYQQLVGLAEKMEGFRAGGAYDDVAGLADRLTDILFRCRLDPFEALAEEYKRRVRELKRAQFLSHFLESHPGVQHKAGVPLGGTFILVYHEWQAVPNDEVDAVVADPQVALRPAATSGPGGLITLTKDDWVTVTKAFTSFAHDEKFVALPDVQAATKALGLDLVFKRAPFADGEIFAKAVTELGTGTVIADFFLPSHVCSGCATIQCSPPPAHLRVETKQACTRADGTAEVSLGVAGATPPLSVRVDGGGLAPTDGTLQLGPGTHAIVVRDANGAESPPVQVTIPPQLVITETRTDTNDAAGTFKVEFVVAGGTPPYSADTGAIVESRYTSPDLPIDQVLVAVIKDAAGCSVSGTFEPGAEQCTLPCDGRAIHEGFRFWIPEPRPRISGYAADLLEYRVVDPAGTEHDLTARASGPLSTPKTLTEAQFPRVVNRWLTELNRLAAEQLGPEPLLEFSYEQASGNATTGNLVVDRIACVDFFLRLRVNFSHNRTPRAIELDYNSRGTVLTESDTEVLIPAFDVTESNWCRRKEPPVPRCEGVDFQLNIIRRAGEHPNTVVLTADPHGSDVPYLYLWEAQDATPALGIGQEVSFTFDPAEPIEKHVRLVAYSKNGCVDVLEDTIDITTVNG